MISTNEGYTRLEYFSEDVAADKNRKEFDIKNHTLCYTNQRPDFLFIGDSITEYWELNAYFRNSDQLIINRGIAGDTTKYLKKRFYVDAVQLKPKYCILGIGINDSIELEGDYWKKLEPVPYSEKLKIVKSNTLYSRDDVDAVIVATPNYLHKEPVVKAAEHGVNVFCEKPIALSYQDCDDMVRACQEHGVIFMAGHVMNFFHGVRHAKKLINDGVIGKVLYCHSARNGWEEQQPTISWKKIREKSGGHLYHHIHELDCVQFLMGGMPEEVTMTGGNVAHQGEAFGDEDDMLFVNMQFSDNRYAVLEWGSAFHWPEHYVLIQGTKGAIKIDMCDCGGTLKIDGKDEHFLVHESQEEDDDRTRIYHSTEMDGAIMYGKPGKKPPMWLHSIMKNEMKYLNGILHGKEVDEEFRPLLTGEAARAAIATADACTRSRFEDRKVKLSEIIG